MNFREKMGQEISGSGLETDVGDMEEEDFFSIPAER